MSKYGAEINSILRDLQDGKIECFKKLFDATYNHLKVIALTYAVDKNDCEDILQEAYLRAYRYINTADTTKDGYNWLCKIVQNVAYDFNNKVERFDYAKKDDLFYEDFYAIFDEALIKSELRDEILKLSSEDMKILYLRFWENKTYKEIAVALHRLKPTVYKRLMSLIKKFKKIFK